MPNQVPIHGILLLGGSGSRMRPTYTGNKHLIPVGGRPMAEYALELLARCGIQSVTAVVGPNDLGHFQRLFDRAGPGPSITFVVQPHPLGTADAVQRCAEMVEQPSVATLWGDNLFEILPSQTVQRFLESPVPCMITAARSEVPQHFSVITESNGRVEEIIDKPSRPAANLVCAGLMLFDSSELFRAVAGVRYNARGEREAMDAVRTFMRAGQLQLDRLAGQWFDAAVSPAFLREAELFALRRGFNHPHSQENSPWTSLAPRHRSGSISTPRGAAI